MRVQQTNTWYTCLVYWSRCTKGLNFSKLLNGFSINVQNEYSAFFALFDIKQTSDDGIFRVLSAFNVSFSVLHLFSPTIDLCVLDPVNITSHTLVQPYDNHTAGTSNVVRECVVDGYPEPITIEWYLNNLKIVRHTANNVKLSETVHSVTIKSTLTMNNVDQDDQGVFECRASNSIGADVETTYFNVLCTSFTFIIYFIVSSLTAADVL